MNGSINNTTSASTSSVPQIKSDDEVVAVIGMAMRLPGGVRCGADFWNLLAEKKSTLSKWPPNRLNPSGHLNSSAGFEGHFIQDVDIREFDPAVFPMPRKELAQLDPVQRQLLQVVYECVQDAGAVFSRESDTNIGCYVGCAPTDWYDMSCVESLPRGSYRTTGSGSFALANRISYEFDLRGPSMTIDTACSSSLTSLDAACQAIRNGKCDGAIVCGANFMFSAPSLLSLRDSGLLSPTNTCKTFDASVDNYGRGEAINAVFIKRLDKALRDGDTVRAVLRATSTNCNGRTTDAIFMPSVCAQEALIRQTYDDAGIVDFGQTAIVECHGTGTDIGDVTETEAVGRCFGKDGVLITAVKPNIGHSEVASGISSLIKAILSIERRKVLPNIFFKTPNPKISFDKYKLRVPVEVEQWPEGCAERVSVNSFGMGGNNSHAIVESLAQLRRDQAKSPDLAASPLTPRESEPHETQLLVLSAVRDTSLNELVDLYKAWVENNQVPLADVSFTLARRRRHEAHRAYAIAAAGELRHVSMSQDSPTPSRILWVFTGQGAQWAGMGAELLETDPVFRDSIRRLDRHLSTLLPPPSWTIEGELRKTAGASLVDKAELTAPLIVAIQIGLVDVLRSWKITPDMVVGHSSGEIAAAYASGAITAQAAISAAFFRGALCSGTEQAGAMAAVGLGPLEVTPYLEAGVVIACNNSHASVTLSGDAGQVDKVVRKLKQSLPDVLIRRLKVEIAYHSHHMLKHGAIYEEKICSLIDSIEPAVPFFSSVTGDRLKGEHSLGPAYWRDNLENPVEFNAAVRSALGQLDDRVLIMEIGPHNALRGPMGQIVKDMRRQDVFISTMQRGQSCRESLLRLAGELFQNKVGLDYSYCCGADGCHVHSLPRYPWKVDTSHWAETRLLREFRLRDNVPHPLLGSPIVEVFYDKAATWRNYLSLAEAPWLVGHKLDGEILLPAAASIAMIGEAIRQLTGERAYSLRNTSLPAQLIVPVEGTVEVVTSLTRESLDEEIPWYSFTISYHDKSLWIRSATGEARAGVDSMPPSKSHGSPESFERSVDEKRWYESASTLGFKYDGLFRGLREIKASPFRRLAIATSSFIGKDEGYAIHPATIDQCLQTISLAVSHGLSRNFNRKLLPMFFGEVLVRPIAGDLSITAEGVSTTTESTTVTVSAEASGETCLLLQGVEVSDVQLVEKNEEFETLIAEVDWKPHADLITSKDLVSCGIPPLSVLETREIEELILLFCIDNVETIDRSEVTIPHMLRHLDWMRQHVEKYRSNLNPLISAESQLYSLTREERLKRAGELLKDRKGQNAFFDLVHHMFIESHSIISGKTHPLEVLRTNQLDVRLYAATETMDYSNLMNVLVYTNPKMKILEIGAGTCATTAKILRMLTSAEGQPLYEKYLVTDVSAGFMQTARERLADFGGVEYGTFDITRDPNEQDLKDKYDLIIGTNVVHVTPDLQATLRRLRGLLSNEGRLFLAELCPDVKCINYAMGFLTGWWEGVGDGRESEPYIRPEIWGEQLLSAGFRLPDIVQSDAERPFGVMTIMIASPRFAIDLPPTVTLLTQKKDGPYVEELTDSLQQRGISTNVRIFGQSLPDQDVICLLDLQSPFLFNLDEPSFGILVRYIKFLEERSILWVTPASQSKCQDPRYGLVRGFATSLREEFRHLQIRIVELDEQASSPNAASAAILSRLYLQTLKPRSPERAIGPELEYAIVDGDVLVPRFHWKSLRDSQAQLTDGPQQVANRFLTIGKPGLIRSVEWSATKREKPAYGEVIINVKVVGLNFRDVAASLGIVRRFDSRLGCEGSGVIMEVGQGVQQLSVGDRVMFVTNDGVAQYHRTSQDLCHRIGDDLSFEEAAACPVVFTTAVAAIVDTARMSAGQTILIHSACGGVGLAAIQVARLQGAEIYCTVSSDEKRDFLVREYRVPTSHIFYSRDTSFLHDIRQATGGRGVDVVLNSLAGDLLQASWKCVAKGGIMVEIGKVDMRRRNKLSLDLFEGNRTFSGLNIEDPNFDMCRSGLTLASSWLRTGTIRSLPIAGSWSADQVHDALHSLFQGKHIGKVVIRMPDDSSSVPTRREALAPTRLRPDRSYLIVGGTGGLGIELCIWLAEKGARHLILLSRSAGNTTAHQSLIGELRAHDCSVQMVPGDVSNPSDLEEAIKQAAKPIAGVIHFGMVLKNEFFAKMTFRDWSTVYAPKVQGSWNLHKLFTTDLDFFVLCSSAIGILGQQKQVNYSASSTFLDSLSKYRRQRGLVASVIDLGAVLDSGTLAKDAFARGFLQRTGIRFLTNEQFILGMELAISRSKVPITPSTRRKIVHHDPGQVIFGLSLSDTGSEKERVGNDARLIFYPTKETKADSSRAHATDSASILKKALESDPSILEKRETTALIAAEIATTLCKLLLKDPGSIDVRKSPANLGVDSLVAVELRHWIWAMFKIKMTAAFVSTAPSLLFVAEDLRKTLLSRHLEQEKV